VLRSRDPDGVRQEVSAYLLVDYAIGTLMYQAALQAEVDPDRAVVYPQPADRTAAGDQPGRVFPSAAGQGHPAGGR
jgi:hypothetical protein